MGFYKSNLISFLKTKACFITYAVVNVLLIVYSIFKLAKADKTITTVLEQEQSLLKFTSVVFVMFLFLAFFYFSKAKNSDLIESISVSAKGRNYFFFSQFSVILSMAFITFMIPFLFSDAVQSEK